MRDIKIKLKKYNLTLITDMPSRSVCETESTPDDNHNRVTF